MDVGIAAAVRNGPDNEWPLVQVYKEHLEDATLADELGFSHFWVSEHHFAEDSWSPSPLVLLGAIAMRTQRIRIGNYVLLLALHNPIRVAEDVATVDVLSNGRMDFAFGAGVRPPESTVFGLDEAESFGRAYEAAEILRKCWTEERFTHEGKYYTFKDVAMTTKPVQAPHVPIYSAAMGPQSLTLSAKRGYGLASALHSPFWETYEESLRAAGRDPGSVPIVSGPVACYVAESRDQAWDEAERGLHWWVEFYNRRGAGMPLPPVDELRHTPGAGIYGMPFYVGTPDQVLEQLSVYKESPIDEINVQLHHAGQPAEQAHRCMRLFAKECLPEISGWGTRAGADR